MSTFNPIGFKLLTNPDEAGQAGPVAAWRSTFNSREYFTVRHVYRSGNGEWLPSKSGVTVPAEQLDSLLAGLADFKPKPAPKGKGNSKAATAA